MTLAALMLAGALGLGAMGPGDPAQEAHAHAVFRSIRCLQCQNQSIDDSEAPLAGELRQIVREQIAAGRSDAEIRRFLTDRYGEFVLLKPRLSAANAVLWAAPFMIVAAGVVGLVRRRRPQEPGSALSPDEIARLGALTTFASTGLHPGVGTVTLPPDSGLTKGVDRGE